MLTVSLNTKFTADIVANVVEDQGNNVVRLTPIIRNSSKIASLQSARTTPLATLDY